MASNDLMATLLKKTAPAVDPSMMTASPGAGFAGGLISTMLAYDQDRRTRDAEREKQRVDHEQELERIRQQHQYYLNADESEVINGFFGALGTNIPPIQPGTVDRDYLATITDLSRQLASRKNTQDQVAERRFAVQRQAEARAARQNAIMKQAQITSQRMALEKQKNEVMAKMASGEITPEAGRAMMTPFITEIKHLRELEAKYYPETVDVDAISPTPDAAPQQFEVLQVADEGI